MYIHTLRNETLEISRVWDETFVMRKIMSKPWV